MVIVLTSIGVVSAQVQPRTTLEQTPQATFKSGVDLVTVSVSVRTEKGRVVRDLQKSDFTVLDAGRPVKILDFYAGDSPISLAILLDISGSMAVGGNMDRAREAVTVATMNLRESSDEAALFTFDTELREVVSFTKELGRVPLRRDSRCRDDGERACESPSRPAGHHRWRRHREHFDSRGSVGHCQLDRCPGLSADSRDPGRPSGQ
jgi:hypothetical protein